MSISWPSALTSNVLNSILGFIDDNEFVILYHCIFCTTSFVLFAVYMETACKYDENFDIHPFAFRTHAHALGKFLAFSDDVLIKLKDC